MGRAKTRSSFINSIEYNCECVVFKIRKQYFKRMYQKSLWRNMNTGKFTATIGFYGNPTYHSLWIGSSDSLSDVQLPYLQHYRDHTRALRDGVARYKVALRLIDQNLVPLTKDGVVLDFPEDKTFLLAGMKNASDFNMRVIDPETDILHLVSRKDFEACL